MNKSILLCMGTRLEIIKMAPVYHALKDAGVNAIVVHTGQHDSMALPLYQFFKVTPDHVVTLDRRSPSPAHLGALLLEKLDAVVEQVKPAAVLVQGDTSSALMGAQAAFYQHIPIGHVGAGLRAHTPYDPFPEEMNRVLIGRLARWHFAPTMQSRADLMAEGIAESTIAMVGNTVIDAALLGVALLERQESVHGFLPQSLVRLRESKADRRLLLVMAHRRENWGENIVSIADAVRELLISEPSFEAVWPVQANVSVADSVRRVLNHLPPEAAARMHLCSPLNYPALLSMLKSCWLVLADSGGIQEEASALHKPVLVLRDSTERAELITAGGGLLVGTSRDVIVAQTKSLLAQPLRYEAMRCALNPFGDGRAGHYIRDILVRELDLDLDPKATAGGVADGAPEAASPVRDLAQKPRKINADATLAPVINAMEAPGSDLAADSASNGIAPVNLPLIGPLASYAGRHAATFFRRSPSAAKFLAAATACAAIAT